MKRNSIFLLLSLLANFVFAQESVILGRIKDVRTGEPIPFVSVKLNNTNITVADSFGNFKVKVDVGKHRFNLAKLGYTSLFQTVRIKFDEVLTVNFFMEPYTNELNKVVVSSSKQEKVLAKEAVSIASIQPYLITNTNSNTLSEVLNKVPGVSVVEGQALIRGSVGWSYNVGSRVMVMLDDMPLMGPDVGDVQWDLLPIEAAENIEVLKGPSSVLYGSSASSGTVSLRTGWPTNKPETKIQVYEGITGNPRTLQSIWWDPTSQPFNSGTFFTHKQKFGQFDLLVSGNVDMVKSYMQLNDSYRARMYIKTRYRFEKIKGLTAGIGSNMMVKKAGRNLLWGGGDTGLYTPWLGATAQDFYRIWSVDPYISYSKPDNYSITLRFRHYNITRFIDTIHYNQGQTDAVANGQAIDLNVTKNWFKGFSTNTGIYLSRVWAVGQVYPGEHSGYSAAAFTQVEYRYKKFNFNAGLRYELNTIGAIEETARPLVRFGINYQPLVRTFIRATYGEGYRFPSITERFVTDHLKSLQVFPNPGLMSERGWYTELGAKQIFNIGNTFSFSLDMALFWQEYKNLIEFHYREWVPASYTLDTINHTIKDIVQAQDGFKTINIDKSRTAGIEFTLEGGGKIDQIEIRTLCGYTYVYPVDLGIDPSLTGFSNYMSGFFRTFSNLSDADKNSLLMYRNRKLGKVDMEFTYKKFMFGYGAYYYSPFEQIDPLLQAKIGLQDYLDKHKNGDFIQNIRIGYEINPNVTVAFLVNNLDNVEFALRPARMEQPRNFNLQFRMKF